MKTGFLAGLWISMLFFLCLGQSFCVKAQEFVFEKDGEVYLIQSAQDMRTLALLVNSNKEVEPGVASHNASYRLTCDIDISAYCTGEGGWEPIGCGREEGEEETYMREFNGTFDGAGHVVTGLYINCPGGENLGLFGTRTYLYEGSDSAEYGKSGRTVIKNLYIRDCDITGALNVGGIMGGMEITSGLQHGGDLYIENCHVTGKITGFDSAGGITGAACAVENCSFAGTVKAYSAAGGIAGVAYYIRGCAVHAKIEGDLERPHGGDAGGIGGIAVCVRDSYMVGTVTGTDNIGGITGRGSCLTGCYAGADVTGDNDTGELLGYPQKFDGLSLPEGASGESEIRNCLTKEEDITAFKELLEGAGEEEETEETEESGKDVWFCATDYAWPNLSWEKGSRFGYTATVTVQEGDSLWKIAEGLYGDGYFWMQIYEKNRECIGGDANMIVPGMVLEIEVNASQADYAAKGDIWEQEKDFLEKGKERGIANAELKSFYRRLLADDLWESAEFWGFNRQISDWVIEDLDGNGQRDMLVMAGEGGALCPGEIWLYFNGAPAYILKDEKNYYEDDSFFGFSFWEDPWMTDVDNDGNLELFFSVFNGGNGGAGGRDGCLFRRVGNGWEECTKELPNDYDVAELRVYVTFIDVDRYEAYCPYLDERIEFDSKNSREIREDEFGSVAGANIRGFFDFKCVKYKGKNALQCREYLCGEGGNVHCVGIAVFILEWDADGVCSVADWWVEGEY
ncbi:MAG: LysM peptidoglycan-binding domain-containing protein [Lachnospiraceae bacterium]|nr:LysM peptidoglycan-binding domain-containing protein [Lachnospiraceae bacterium]